LDHDYGRTLRRPGSYNVDVYNMCLFRYEGLYIGPSPVGKGAYDTSGIIGPSDAIVRRDELWFYYMGSQYLALPKEKDLPDVS